MGEQRHGDVIEIDGRVLRGGPSARRGGKERFGLGRDRGHRALDVELQGEQLAMGGVVRRPAAGGRQCGDGAGAAALGELEGQVAAERVARQVGQRPARVVHGLLERVEQAGLGRRFGEGRPAGVAGQGEREHIVIALQGGQHELPDAPGVHEAVDEHERGAAAASVGRGEAQSESQSCTCVPERRPERSPACS